MAHRITVYIVDPADKKIHVEHTFYGRDAAEAERHKEHHLAACPYFQEADLAGNTSEESDDIDDFDWPAVEESDDDGDDTDVIDMELED